MSYLNDFCFLCLGHHQDLNNILSQDKDGILLQEKLMAFLPEYELLKSEIPKFICTNCSENLCNIYKYKQKCLANVAILSDYVQKLISRDGYFNYSAIKLANILYYKETKLLNECPTNIPDYNMETDQVEIKCEIFEDVYPTLENQTSENRPASVVSVSKEFEDATDNEEDNKIEIEDNVILKEDLQPSSEQETEEEISKNLPLKEEISFEDECNQKEDSTVIKKGTVTMCSKSTYTDPKILELTKKFQYVCRFCQKEFQYRNVLKRHIRTHTGERPFECPTCQKKFTILSHLTDHKRTHTNERPYLCTICKKCFTQSSVLKKHILIHSGVKPYSCQFCEYKCSQKSHLKLHMRVHTGERPEICKYCNIAFGQSSNLNKHIRSKHKEVFQNEIS